MFNQEPAEEQGQLSEPEGREAEPREKEGNAYKHQDSTNSRSVDYNEQKSELNNHTSWSSAPKIQKSELSEPSAQVAGREDQSCGCPHKPEGRGGESRGSCYSEEGVDCVLQVDNNSEGDDGFLQREGSQRRSRRRFRRVNPRGERELITDGQEPANYNTVGGTTFLSDSLLLLHNDKVHCCQRRKSNILQYIILTHIPYETNAGFCSET